MSPLWGFRPTELGGPGNTWPYITWPHGWFCGFTQCRHQSCQAQLAPDCCVFRPPCLAGRLSLALPCTEHRTLPAPQLPCGRCGTWGMDGYMDNAKGDELSFHRAWGRGEAAERKTSSAVAFYIQGHQDYYCDKTLPTGGYTTVVEETPVEGE